tara:strand:+ start:465 stop:647 length:183 start_codon:yes stop_codon:yes gene_type:complete
LGLQFIEHQAYVSIEAGDLVVVELVISTYRRSVGVIRGHLDIIGSRRLINDAWMIGTMRI